MTDVPLPTDRRPHRRAIASRGGAAVLIVAALVSILAVAAPGRGSDTTQDRDGRMFFEKNIRPILFEHCDSCHSKRAKKIHGGLNLDHAEGWRRGGDQGPAIVPGKLDDSLLIRVVRHDDQDLQMPPKGKLPDHEIAMLTQWVAMGAPDPRTGDAEAVGPVGIDVEKGRASWSFRPPADPPLPEVGDAAWVRTPLDRFILAALEAKGLGPAPAADRRTLIRRATFDLTGLPPSPAEVDAFLADESPDAFARVIDRLLASPRYGERWGRHWLDVARYADSNGLDENVAHGNAWRYRDYVIASFNVDKPYDRFLREQIAGDLLQAEGGEAGARERLIATGFLAPGPKVLAEPDEAKLEMDIVDEQIDTVGRAFMGLTLGCARCHDHKFDPVATTDYYALAGIFRSTRTMETFKKVARWHENSLADDQDRQRRAEHEAKVAGQKQAIADLIRRSNERLKATSGDGFKLPKKPESLYTEEERAELKRSRDALGQLEKSAPAMPSAMGETEGQVADVRVHIRGSHLALGEAVPRRVPIVLASASAPSFEASRSGRLELARWLAGPDHPLTARVMANRIWRWHFGRGIVATPDNFGLLGERPANPPLLDWLARRFVESGWSVKAMHRLIMLSNAYQMGAGFDPTAAAVDPENRLLWRFAPRRLEAEAIRDAMLAVAGTLDATLGGSLLEVANRAYLFDHTSKDGTTYESRRRSVYLPIVRNHMYDAFDLFDYSDASVANGDRATTTVAPQALFVMNDELATQAAQDLASDLLATASSEDAERTQRLYARAYGRPPKPEEAARALAFLDRFAGGLAATEPEPRLRARLAWQALCQASSRRMSSSTSADEGPTVDQFDWGLTSRRRMLKGCGSGFGTLALSALLAEESRGARPAAKGDDSLQPRTTHFPARAKRVIFLFMKGGPSHVDTFDYKPLLQRDSGKDFPFAKPRVQFAKTGKLLGSPWKFEKHGESGIEVSELFPNVARCVDDLCIINSVHGTNAAHGGALLKLHTGSDNFIRPSMGSWITYGLGTENRDLPGFLTICPTLAHGGVLNWGSAFLPARYQGTPLGNASVPSDRAGVRHIENARTPRELQRLQLDLIAELNRDHLEGVGPDLELEGRLDSFELAFRMQAAMPEIQSLAGESPKTLKAYGLDDPATANFGRQCLLARRFAERGVRFVQVTQSDGQVQWDQHSKLKDGHTKNACEVDKPIAGLLADLKARGLLGDTLVLWGGEFGRTPTAEGTDGRDHNPEGFTMWMAGGGVKGGIKYGATDDYGYYAVDRKMHIHDVHATILHLLGLDHEKLTYQNAGRDFRLTDVAGRVAREILA